MGNCLQKDLLKILTLGVNTIPALFLFRGGKVEKSLIGYMTKDALKAKLGL